MCDLLRDVQEGDRIRIKGVLYEVLSVFEDAIRQPERTPPIRPYLTIYLHDMRTKTLFPTHQLHWYYDTNECVLIGKKQIRIEETDILVFPSAEHQTPSREKKREKRKEMEREKKTHSPVAEKHPDTWKKRVATLIMRVLTEQQERNAALHALKERILTYHEQEEARNIRLLAVLHDILKEYKGEMIERLHISMLCQILTGCEGISVYGVKRYPAREDTAKRVLHDACLLGFPREEGEAFIQWCLTQGRALWSIPLSEERIWEGKGGSVLLAYEHEAEQVEHARFLLAFLFPREKEIPLTGWSADVPERYWTWPLQKAVWKRMGE